MPQQALDTTQLARLVGITPRHVQRLTQEGIFTRARDTDGNELRGRYPLMAIRAYCDHLRAQMNLTDASQTRYEASRNEKVAAEAEMAQLRLKQYKGELHHSRDVEFVMTNMLTAFKARVLAIPSRVARLCIGKKFREIFDLISSEIELALRELHTYDRSLFAEAGAVYLAKQGVDLGTLNGEAQREPAVAD